LPDISTGAGSSTGPPRPALGAGPQLLGLLGAEASGKTTLARDLARVLDAVLVPEALRAFVIRHGRPPRQEEQARVMDEQLADESLAIERARATGREWVVCDPCVLMTPVYSLVYFDDASLLPAGLEHQQEYRIVLHCRPDIPWTADPGQRDGPAHRTRVDEALSELIRERHLPTHDVSGPETRRLARALQLVRET